MKVRTGLKAWVACVGLLWLSSTYAAESEESPVKVTVSGASTALADNIKAYLPPRRKLDCNSSRNEVQRYLDASQDKLVEASEALGYFSANFDLTTVQQSGCWVLNIVVQPGPPVLVEQSNINLSGEGQNFFAFRKVVNDYPYDPGDVFVSQGYEDFKGSLTRVSSRYGFFDADFKEHQVLVNPEERSAVINLEYETGERYKLGKVDVEQDVLADRYLQRYVRLDEGDYYDSTKLIEQQRLLEGSGYYQGVEINTQYNAAEDGQVPVSINTIRRERYSYLANLGYGTDTEFRVQAQGEAHWVNEKGHKAEAGLLFSSKEAELKASYKVPLWQPEHEYASLSGGWSSSDNDDIKSNALDVEFSYNRRNDAGWSQTAFIKYLNEETEVDGQEPSRAQLTLVGARVSKTEADDNLFPTRGWRAQAELQGSYDRFLSDQSLLQGSLLARYLYTLANEGKVIVQGNVGATLIDEFEVMPKSLRFFAGGQNSVRGYSFESIGEADADGKIIGGQNLLTASLEYEHPIREKFGAAVFVDAGSAFDDWGNLKTQVGVGVGARYKSPVGPIRVDLAVPEDDFSDVHLYFSLGPDL